MQAPRCSWALAAERHSSPLLSASTARCGPSRCDRKPLTCSVTGEQQAPLQADSSRRGCPPAALCVGRRWALELGASALLLALAPPLPSSAASSEWAPAVIRPELAPDQRLYDPTDPQVRSCLLLAPPCCFPRCCRLSANTFAGPLFYSTFPVLRPSHMRLSTHHALAPIPRHRTAAPQLRAAAQLLQDALNAQDVRQEEALWTRIIKEYGGLDSNWVPDLVGRAWGESPPGATWRPALLAAGPVGHLGAATHRLTQAVTLQLPNFTVALFLGGTCRMPQGVHLARGHVRRLPGPAARAVQATAATPAAGRAGCRRRWPTTTRASASAPGRWILY